jgi:ComF family protein
LAHPTVTNTPCLDSASPQRRPGWRLARQCEICRGWANAAVCSACRSRFVPLLPRCPRCALPSPEGAVCGGCLRAPPPWSTCVAALDYAFPWDRLLSRFKFDQRPDLGAPLAALLAQALAARPVERETVVTAVPLSAARLAERGYNQAWELARRVARALTLRADPRLLLRCRDTPHQVGLGRAERERNLRQALLATPEHASAIDGRTIALVDDVMTTGVTAQAATRALLAAGAASVSVWVVARTPPEGDR